MEPFRDSLGWSPSIPQRMPPVNNSCCHDMLTQSAIEQGRQEAVRQRTFRQNRDLLTADTSSVEQTQQSSTHSITQPLNSSTQWSLPSEIVPALEEEDLPLDNLEKFGPLVSASELNLDFIQDNINVFDEVDTSFSEYPNNQSASATTKVATSSNLFINAEQQPHFQHSAVNKVPEMAPRSSTINDPGFTAAAYTKSTHINNDEQFVTPRTAQSLTSSPAWPMTGNQTAFLTPSFGVMPQYPSNSRIGVDLTPASSGFSLPYGFGAPLQASHSHTLQRYRPVNGRAHLGFDTNQYQPLALPPSSSYIQAPGLMMTQGAGSIVPQYPDAMMRNFARPSAHVGGDLSTQNPYPGAATGQKRKYTSDEHSGRVTKTPRTTITAATNPPGHVTTAGRPALPNIAPTSVAVGGNQQTSVTPNNVSADQRRPDARNTATQVWTADGVTYRVLMRLNNNVMVTRKAATKIIGAQTLVELHTPHGHWALTQSYNAVHPNNNDVTTAAPGQEDWTEERNSGRPDILFELHPQGRYGYTGTRTRKPQHTYPPLVHTDGRIFLSHDGMPMRASIHLPDMVSINVEGWRIEAIRRMDSNISNQDFVDRMPIARRTGNRRRPVAGTLETRCTRDRQRMRIITWPEPAAKSYIDRKVVEETVRIEGPDSNSTRRLSDLTDDQIDIQKIVTYGGKDKRAGSRRLSPTKRYTKHEDNMKKLFISGLDINSEEVGIVAGRLDEVARLLNRSVDIVAVRRDAIGY